jgi:hypothetical protein
MLARYFAPASMILITVHTSLYSPGAYTGVRVPGKQGLPRERENAEPVFAKGWISPRPVLITSSRSVGCKMTCVPRLVRWGQQTLHPKVRRFALAMQSHELARMEVVVGIVVSLASDFISANSAKRSAKYRWTSCGDCWLICSCRVVPTVYGDGPCRGDRGWRNPEPLAIGTRCAIWMACQKPATESGRAMPGPRAINAE